MIRNNIIRKFHSSVQTGYRELSLEQMNNIHNAVKIHRSIAGKETCDVYNVNQNTYETILSELNSNIYKKFANCGDWNQFIQFWSYYYDKIAREQLLQLLQWQHKHRRYMRAKNLQKAEDDVLRARENVNKAVEYLSNEIRKLSLEEDKKNRLCDAYRTSENDGKPYVPKYPETFKDIEEDDIFWMNDKYDKY